MYRFAKPGLIWLLWLIPALASAQRYAYQPAMVRLSGVLVSAAGQTADGAALRFPALRLSAPIDVQGDEASPTEQSVPLLHLVLNPEHMHTFKTLKGQPVWITGTLFHADNGHHQTVVLMTPCQIIRRQSRTPH